MPHGARRLRGIEASTAFHRKQGQTSPGPGERRGNQTPPLPVSDRFGPIRGDFAFHSQPARPTLDTKSPLFVDLRAPRPRRWTVSPTPWPGLLVVFVVGFAVLGTGDTVDEDVH